MMLLTRLWPRTVAVQIAGLVVLSLLVTYAIALGVLTFVTRTVPPDTGPVADFLRIATVTQLAHATRSAAELASLVDTARGAGINVDVVATVDLVDSTNTSAPRFIRFVEHRLEEVYGFEILEARPPTAGREAIVLKLDRDKALVFASLRTQPSAAADAFLSPRTVFPAVFTFTIITVFVLFLSTYAVRWITRPLTSIAGVANSFGRSPAGDRQLSESGPLEISHVAKALNDMRTRIRTLVDNRTRMLAGIGHDLRTPLTRLRLRAERCEDKELRVSMLRELTSIDGMIDETLTFLRDDARSEELSRIDLPSLLQTICSEFSDVGYSVSYEGLDHLAYACRGRALTRAITNVVENGTKFGSMVWISLRVLEDDSVQIEVSDDGPGVPFSLRERAFQPFFKADVARTTAERTGFGLGLSIARDVIKAHGGDIVLLERVPRGLTVQILLPADGSGELLGSGEEVQSNQVNVARAIEST